MQQQPSTSPPEKTTDAAPSISEVASLPTTRPSGCPFDPPEELARIREQQPLSRMVYPDGHVGWLVTGHALARAVAADPRFSSRYELMHYPVPGAAITEIPPAPIGDLTGIETVTVSIQAANRDPEKFADPDTLDLHRHATGHLAFGHGIHQCLGQQLARVEMRVAYPALFTQFPTLRLAIPPEDVPLRTNMDIYGVRRLPVTWDEA